MVGVTMSPKPSPKPPSIEKKIKYLAATLAASGMKAGMFETMDAETAADYCLELAKEILGYTIDDDTSD
jgi:hypothetical protein